MTTTELTCPKCQGTMRTYERSGIAIDQCHDCRGVFLDRGQLERLIDADTQRDQPPPNDTSQHRRDGEHGRRRSSVSGTTGDTKRRGGFLSEPFE